MILEHRIGGVERQVRSQKGLKSIGIQIKGGLPRRSKEMPLSEISRDRARETRTYYLLAIIEMVSGNAKTTRQERSETDRGARYGATYSPQLLLAKVRQELSDV